MSVILIAAYLSTKCDRHRYIQVTPDNYSYIEDYCRSIKNNGIYALILTDECSEDFIAKHSIETDMYSIKLVPIVPLLLTNIKFRDTIHIHDERFFYFLNAIESDLGSNLLSESEYLVFTDVSDVQILNPIEDMIELDPNLL